MGAAHGRQLLRCITRLPMLCQRVDNFGQGASFEPVLLGPTPAFWRLGSAGGSRLCQILADMIIIAQEGGLLAKDFPGLEPDPFGSISQRMDLAVGSPACPTRTVAPAPSHFIDFTEGGSVDRVGFAQAPSRGQPDFLPIPRFLALARSGCHRA